MRHKDLGIWQTWTWTQVLEIVRAYAVGLHRLGLQRGETIAIVGGNRSQVGGTAVSSTVRANATGLPVEAAGLLFNFAAFSAPLPKGRRRGEVRGEKVISANCIMSLTPLLKSASGRRVSSLRSAGVRSHRLAVALRRSASLLAWRPLRKSWQRIARIGVGDASHVSNGVRVQI